MFYSATFYHNVEGKNVRIRLMGSGLPKKIFKVYFLIISNVKTFIILYNYHFTLNSLKVSSYEYV